MVLHIKQCVWAAKLNDIRTEVIKEKIKIIKKRKKYRAQRNWDAQI